MATNMNGANVKEAPTSFGDILRFKREQLGLSQQTLAEKAGIDRTYISMLESKGNPQFSKIQQLATAMGLTLSDFFRVDPRELQPPTVVIRFSGAEKERLHKERLIMEDTIPIPIIRSVLPLRKKFVEPEDVEGYLLLDRQTVEGQIHIDGKKPLVALRSEHYPLLVIDMMDTEVRDNAVFLLERSDKVMVRRSITLESGTLFEPVTPGTDEKPIAYIGKKKEVEILGRIIFMVSSH